MPIKSKKQYGFMQAAAHGKSDSGLGKNMKGLGPSKKVAEKFIHETPPAKRSAFMSAIKGKNGR